MTDPVVTDPTVIDPTVIDPTLIDLGVSASVEWSHLVTAAVLGTDRHRLPLSGAGWESIASTTDPAVELLNRAAAVATARRTGVRPAPVPLLMTPAPPDPRPPCPAAAANQLARMLRGEHDVLLPEWFQRCEAAGCQPPRHLVPALLLRGRRSPAFAAAARRLIGPLADWLVDAMPELGLGAPSAPRPTPLVGDEFVMPPRPVDSAAVVSAIVQTFLDRSATWAAASQMRVAVASLDERWLPALILELNRVPFYSVTERARVDLLGLAETRAAMIVALSIVADDHPSS